MNAKKITANNQTYVDPKTIINTSPELQKLYMRAKMMQWLIVAISIVVFIITLRTPAIPVVGNWAVGVYIGFTWGLIVPVLDIIALFFIVRFRYDALFVITKVTLIMFFLGTLGFFFLGWTNFCCTNEGADLERKVQWIIYLIALLGYFVPKVVSAYALALLDNKIRLQKKKAG